MVSGLVREQEVEMRTMYAGVKERLWGDIWRK
jgi:hypothetical protein